MSQVDAAMCCFDVCWLLSVTCVLCSVPVVRSCRHVAVYVCLLLCRIAKERGGGGGDAYDDEDAEMKMAMQLSLS